MMPAPVLLLLVKTTLVLLAALGITRVLQRASAGARHLVWLSTLGALLLVPLVAVWSPLRLAVLPAVPRTVSAPSAVDAPSAVAAPLASAPAPIAESMPLAPHVAPNGTAVVPAALRDRLQLDDAVGGVLALWAVVALAIGGSLAAAWLSARRIVLRARPLDGADWLDPLYEIADRLDLSEPPRLLRSEDAKMPFACGVTRPTVVLPAESDHWTLDRRRAVLLHELAHVRRRDLAGHTLARVLCAVYWFHPLVWTAARRLRAESEHACDDVALSCGARPADYAEHLLEIVTSVRRDATPVVALAMARRSEFEGRMLAILDPERVRATPSRRQAASLVGMLVLFAVLVGAAAPSPAAERTREMAALGDAQPPAPRPLLSAPEPRPTPAPAPIGIASPQPSPDAGALHQYDDDPADTTVAPARPVDRAPDDRMAGLRDMVVRVDVTGRSAAADERVALLARVLRGDSSASLRRIAAWGLAEHADQSEATEALAVAVRRDASPAVREMAAWALSEADHEGAARDALAGALRDDDVRVRATAAWALGSMGDRQAADALTGALGDASAEVRTRAVWALGSIEPRQAPRALVAMLGDREPRVRELTAWALYEIQDPSAIPALQAAMRTERDTDLQVAYVRALAVLGEQSVDALRGLLESPDARIKSVAVRALAGGRASGPWPWPWPQPRPYP
jgi:beta-lactamase regulating signal transducer with metallopeptidase domain/HEAT repeat protein